MLPLDLPSCLGLVTFPTQRHGSHPRGRPVGAGRRRSPKGSAPVAVPRTQRSDCTGRPDASWVAVPLGETNTWNRPGRPARSCSEWSQSRMRNRSDVVGRAPISRVGWVSRFLRRRCGWECRDDWLDDWPKERKSHAALWASLRRDASGSGLDRGRRGNNPPSTV